MADTTPVTPAPIPTVPVTKPFWYSKTLWVNIIAAVALFIQTRTGYVLSPDLQAYAIIAVNGLMRLLTKQEVTFY